MKKKVLSIALMVFVIIGLVLVLSSIGIREIISLVFKANPYLLGLSFLSLFGMYFMWVLVWSISTKKIIGKDVSILKTIPIFFAGAFFNTLTPGAKVGGEPIRAYYSSKVHGGSKSTHMAGILFQKLLNYIAHGIIIIFSLASLVYLFGYGEFRNIIFVSISVFVLIVFLIFFINIINKKSEWLFNKLSFLYSFFENHFEDEDHFTNYLNKKYNNFSSKFGILMEDKRKSLFLLSLSVLGKLFLVSTFYFVFLALGIEISFFYVLISVTFVEAISELSFVPGGIGIAEGGFIFVYSLFSLSPVNAASATLLARGVEYFYLIIVGGFSYLYLRNKY